MIDSMAEAIKMFNGGVVVISHDFRLLQQVAEEIWVIDKGNTHTIKILTSIILAHVLRFYDLALCYCNFLEFSVLSSHCTVNIQNIFSFLFFFISIFLGLHVFDGDIRAYKASLKKLHGYKK